jgi:GNAT superfamily N-acetyltransferase
MDYFYFKKRMASGAPGPDLGDGLRVVIWRPTPGRPVRRDLPLVPFGIWSLFHFLGVFASRDYFLVLVLAGPRLVHRTCIFPAHYRFPFMAARDLQAGGLWTDPGWRGRGLGLAALGEAFRRPECQGRTLWYMVREDNRPSVRLAEKAGFLLWGRGGRVDPWGIGALGRYEVAEVLPSRPPERGSVWEPDPGQ